jgi:hypothetical protein
MVGRTCRGETRRVSGYKAIKINDRDHVPLDKLGVISAHAYCSCLSNYPLSIETEYVGLQVQYCFWWVYQCTKCRILIFGPPRAD